MGRQDTNATLMVALLLCLGCSATRSVRPIGDGRLGAALSVGGPLFVNLGPPLPVPVTVLSARYGISDTTDIDLGITLPVVPTLALDAGASTLVVRPRKLRPALMLGGRVITVGPLRGHAAPRVLLEGHATAAWAVTPGLLAYGGGDVMAETHYGRLRPSVIVGMQYRLPTSGLSLSAEARWLAFAAPSSSLSVRYASLRGYGATGVVLAVGYAFDVKRTP